MVLVHSYVSLPEGNLTHRSKLLIILSLDPPPDRIWEAHDWVPTNNDIYHVLPLTRVSIIDIFGEHPKTNNIVYTTGFTYEIAALFLVDQEARLNSTRMVDMSSPIQ